MAINKFLQHLEVNFTCWEEPAGKSYSPREGVEVEGADPGNTENVMTGHVNRENVPAGALAGRKAAG